MITLPRAPPLLLFLFCLQRSKHRSHHLESNLPTCVFCFGLFFFRSCQTWSSWDTLDLSPVGNVESCISRACTPRILEHPRGLVGTRANYPLPAFLVFKLFGQTFLVVHKKSGLLFAYQELRLAEMLILRSPPQRDIKPQFHPEELNAGLTAVEHNPFLQYSVYNYLYTLL